MCRAAHIVSSGEWFTALELLSGGTAGAPSRHRFPIANAQHMINSGWPLLYQKPPTHLRQWMGPLCTAGFGEGEQCMIRSGFGPSSLFFYLGGI